jgi:hypothetical protein
MIDQRVYAGVVKGTPPFQESRMRVLVVEDEPKIAGFLRKGLAENGFVVDVANKCFPQ